VLKPPGFLPDDTENDGSPQSAKNLEAEIELTEAH
jgi:hypothetical protein